MFSKSLLIASVLSTCVLYCATTTITSGNYGPVRPGEEDGRFPPKAAKGESAALDPECRPELKDRSAAVSGKPTDEGQKESGKVAVIPGAGGSDPAGRTDKGSPADVKNDVKVVVEKDPAQNPTTDPANHRDSKAAADMKPKARDDSYFVVARDGGKESVYDRKAEDAPPGEGKAEKGDEKPSDPGGKFFSETDRDDFDQKGTASWYGRDFDGRPTASGEKFDSRKLTAAHRSLPLGTIILVRNMENKKEVVLRINDRGPFVKGRVLDISEYGSERLGYKEKGLATVGIRVVRPGDAKSRGAGATKGYYDLNKEEATKGGVETKKGQEETGSETAGGREKAREIGDAEKGTGVDPRDAPVPEKKIREVKREYRGEETVSGYSVQVGVFEKEFNALSAAETLRHLNVPLRVVKRGSLFVVKAGSFSTKEAAEPLKDKLAATGRRVFVTGP